MKRSTFVFVVLAFVSAFAFAQEKQPATEASQEGLNSKQEQASAEQTEEMQPWVKTPSPDRNLNRMHPRFKPLDAAGKPIFSANNQFNQSDKQVLQQTSAQFNLAATCGKCHDTNFILAHTLHYKNGKSLATCTDCHIQGGKLEVLANSVDAEGYFKKAHLLIKKPDADACAKCHAEVAPVHFAHLSNNFGKEKLKEGLHSITATQGALFSGARISDSLLNIAGKQALTQPFDVHAARGVDCAACHHTRNSPRRVEVPSDAPKHLKADPRSPLLHEYLKRPDHRFGASNCTDCHNPLKEHQFLPYKQRHFERLECSACHNSRSYLPSYQALDETVVDTNGEPVAYWRGVDAKETDNFNTAYIKPYSHPLVPIKRNGVVALASVNTVAHFFWIDEATGKPVNNHLLKRAFLNGGKTYTKQILKAFDANKDGKLSKSELRIDSKAKFEAVASALKSIGVAKPKIVAEVKPYEVVHGTIEGEKLKVSCDECHSAKSRVGANITVAPFVPFSANIEWSKDFNLANLNGSFVSDDKGVEFKFKGKPEGFYVFGLARGHISDTIGLLLFVMTLLGVLGHGAFRAYMRRKLGLKPPKTKKMYLYSVYERLWHWLMAGAIILLLLSGLEIHFYGSFTLFGLAPAVNLHNIIAAILIINAALALFYHVATGEIRKFIPPKDTFIEEVISQVKFYMSGIFWGKPHPVEKTHERKFNALQQITYFGLLNVLLPLQVITGAVIWLLGEFPEISAYVGQLYYWALIHNFGAWLFLSFLTAHLYLITTGPTIGAHLKGMITGYEDVETEH